MTREWSSWNITALFWNVYCQIDLVLWREGIWFLSVVLFWAGCFITMLLSLLFPETFGAYLKHAWQNLPVLVLSLYCNIVIESIDILHVILEQFCNFFHLKTILKDKHKIVFQGTSRKSYVWAKRYGWFNLVKVTFPLPEGHHHMNLVLTLALTICLLAQTVFYYLS